MKTPILLLALFLTLFSPALQAQSAFDIWVKSEIDKLISQQNQTNVEKNGKGADRQKESPSVDSRSTSLVDQSSATDFFSIAANVIPVTPGLSQFTSGTGSASNSPSATGSTTATASLYALLAALNKTAPTDPKFYENHVFSRRLSFTVGTAASQEATDNTTVPATIYGTKFLLIPGRELYDKNNLKSLAGVQKALSDAAANSAGLKSKIKEIMFAGLHPSDVDLRGLIDEEKLNAFELEAFSDSTFQHTLSNLSPTTVKQIQSLLEQSLETFSTEQAAIQDTYDRISKGMQMSISYTAEIRDPKGNNNHRAELIFDYGLSQRINWTFNASADYTDRKMALDSKGGRAATEFRGNLTKSDSAWARGPIQLSFSGEAKWLTAQKPQYTFQAKLTIPLSAGIDLPIAYQYANRSAQLNQTSSEAHLGLSFDVSRLFQSLK